MEHAQQLVPAIRKIRNGYVMGVWLMHPYVQVHGATANVLWRLSQAHIHIKASETATRMGKLKTKRTQSVISLYIQRWQGQSTEKEENNMPYLLFTQLFWLSTNSLALLNTQVNPAKADLKQACVHFGETLKWARTCPIKLSTPPKKTPANKKTTIFPHLNKHSPYQAT